jgi:hypothetical protein
MQAGSLRRRNIGIQVYSNESCISTGGLQRAFREEWKPDKGGSLPPNRSET